MLGETGGQDKTCGCTARPAPLPRPGHPLFSCARRRVAQMQHQHARAHAHAPAPAHARARTPTPSGVAGTYFPLLSRQDPFVAIFSYPAGVGRVSAAMVAQHTTTTSIGAGGCTYTPKHTHTHTRDTRARPGHAHTHQVPGRGKVRIYAGGRTHVFVCARVHLCPGQRATKGVVVCPDAWQREPWQHVCEQCDGAGACPVRGVEKAQAGSSNGTQGVWAVQGERPRACDLWCGGSQVDGHVRLGWELEHPARGNACAPPTPQRAPRTLDEGGREQEGGCRAQRRRCLASCLGEHDCVGCQTVVTTIDTLAQL